MIYSLKSLKCSMMGYNSQHKVIVINLPKKFPFWASRIQAQFGSHDSLSEALFEILQHDEAKEIDKGSLSYFSEFQKHCSMVWCNSQTLVILGNFHSIMINNSQTKAMLITISKNVRFREVTRTQFGPKLCNLLSHDLLFEDSLRCCSIKKYSWQIIVTANFAKKYLFGPMNNLDAT